MERKKLKAMLRDSMFRWPPQKNAFWWTVTALLLAAGAVMARSGMNEGYVYIALGGILFTVIFVFWIAGEDEDREGAEGDGGHGPSPEVSARHGLRPFYGRKPEDCAFKVGDIVLVRGGCPDYFAIVAALPPSPEYVNSHPAAYCEIDDSYLVLTGDGPFIECHRHPHVSLVFPADEGQLTKETLAALRRGLRRFQDEDNRRTASQA